VSKLTITQVKSSAGASRKQNETLKTLGLGKIGRTVERDDHPTVRGLVHAIDHLVKIDG
jgi:large subunit ribosomal protein L30